MIGYLVDTSAIWRLLRDEDLRARWIGPIESGLIKICAPTRLELLYSATGPSHRDELEEELAALFRDAPVPKDAWRWAEAGQYKLTQKSQHRGAGAIDLVVCATAVHHGLTILHVDDDFAAVGRVLHEVAERNVLRADALPDR